MIDSSKLLILPCTGHVISLASVFVRLSVFRDFLENFAKLLDPTEYLNLFTVTNVPFL